MTSAYDASGMQTAWDSTSLTRLIACPRLYFYQNIMGWAPKTESVHLTFGQLLHSAREHLERNLAAGSSAAEALEDALHWLLVESKDFKSDDPYKNRDTLVRTFIWHALEYEHDSMQTLILANGKPAVELSFRFELDGKYMLCGHLDRLAQFSGYTWVTDLKTTKSALGNQFAMQYQLTIQMPLYTLAGRIIYNAPVRGVIVEAAQVLVEGNRFKRFPLVYTETWLSEFLGHMQHHIRLAEQYHQADFWPQNLTACHKYGGCQFRDICSRSPEVRQMFLESTFTIRRWDPLQIRGEEE